MQKNPAKVGVTGGIGSGKSVVCKIFKILGIPVYNSDVRAREIMVDNPFVVSSIKKCFGHEAYLQNGEINKVFLANEVFNNKEKLEKINAIVHPAVAQDFDHWITLQEDTPYVVKEAALLVEAGSYKTIDFLVTVTAPIELRINRILSRDPHRTPKDVNAIISRQLSDKSKLKKSHFEIVNDSNSLVIPQILRIHNQLISSRQVG